MYRIEFGDNIPDAVVETWDEVREIVGDNCENEVDVVDIIEIFD